MTRQRKPGVDLMTEGQILVRGTRDPMEALRLYVDCLHIQDPDILYGVTPDGGDPDLCAVECMADRLHYMLATARPGLYRKIHCLPSSLLYDECAWQIGFAKAKGPGVFEAVYFP